MVKPAYVIHPSDSLKGIVSVPPDKSISHRAVILASLAEGESKINNFLFAQDTLATVNALRELGVDIQRCDAASLVIRGVGVDGYSKPNKALDLQNSGTGMRLLAGLMAGQAFHSELVGDSSLMRRPMGRIIEPLGRMGASISSENGLAPLNIKGVDQLRAIQYKLPVPSAQVKSCILLAGLNAKGCTEVVESTQTRDHTEKLLRTFGCKIEAERESIKIFGGQTLLPAEVNIPGDISSAAFFIVGASIANKSKVVLPSIGVNETRMGVINILRLMGADISLQNKHYLNDEPVADIHVNGVEKLQGIDIPIEQVPLAIDEFPALFIAAACAKGTTVLHCAEELRIKESDRIAVMSEGLNRLGIKTETQQDGIIIHGGKIKGGKVNSHGDHRVAMAFTMASLAADNEIIIENCACVDTSFPGFTQIADSSGLNITESQVTFT